MINKKRQDIIINAASAHRESLRKNLQHRLEVARAEGNQALIHQLEKEAAYLNLN
ncbi:conserved hypothetical protein [Gloeothece citriformis PCC 7424]|uniref:Uncharacterized protein n=1 Tax=Gloeothece citriformis (strain PCC 7424) TaxID=65393 RepID=B7KKT7_GLOC7|nr:hypothetical protein [Gloeothece citriformis]ACK71056.1 conserved hypothetical protein [Gloeothece citriformis PCC 7424]